MSSTKQHKKLFALVDCNNFYVSCERVFSPCLREKAVVILSNNDGCIIARSNEAKALGIPMGAPFFQWKDFFKNHRVIALSSNYSLYGDMSVRVMKVLEQFGCDMEIYSIDEAFLEFHEGDAVETIARQARETVLRWTGIPVSIGIAPTKTLAKVANHIAKKNKTHNDVHYLSSNEEIEAALAKFPVGDVWGIGSRSAELLNRHGIRTAKQLSEAEDQWVQKQLKIIGLKTAMELRGISCLSLETAASPQKSICSSRAFGRPVEAIDDLYEAIATYTARAAEKLRIQHSLTSTLIVFANLHPFLLRESAYIKIILTEPSNYTPTLVHHAKRAIDAIYKKGTSYRKVGIICEGLVPESCYQQDLFSEETVDAAKRNKLMKLMDAVNRECGHKVIQTAAEGTTNTWKMRRERQTDHFTTEWDQILKIKI